MSKGRRRYRWRKVRWGRLALLVVVMLLVLGAVTLGVVKLVALIGAAWGEGAATPPIATSTLSQASTPAAATTPPPRDTQPPSPSPTPLSFAELHSPYAYLLDLQEGRVLLNMRGEDRIAPASMTKIMTALLAIEAGGDMERKVRLNEDMFPALYEKNASMAGFRPGEAVRALDLLYGILLPSGAEASMGMAQEVAGSQEAFVDRMNARAAELGMDNTHFANATGLHDEQNYSTARDIAVLLEAAWGNETFRQVFTTMRHSTAATNGHPDGITFYSTLHGKVESLAFAGGEIRGGKTGYESEAGLCLASVAQKDGRNYLLVTAAAPGTGRGEPLHILDALKAYGELLP